MTDILEFGRLSDFMRSVAVGKIQSYFESVFVRQVLSEVPVIEKYEVTEQADGDKFVSSVHIQRYFSNLFEKLPLIAVTTVGGSARVQTIGGMLAGDRIDSSEVFNQFGVLAPYSLADGDDLIIEIEDVTYTLQFRDSMFADINAITMREMQDVVKMLIQNVLLYDGGAGYLYMTDFYGRPIDIVGGSVVPKLVLHSGPSDRVRNQGYSVAEEMSLVIDVVTADRNQRTELADVLCTLFGFYLFDKELGQWVYPSNAAIFQKDFSRKGESEMALEGAPVDKLYFDSVTITATVFGSVQRVSSVDSLTISSEGIIT